MTDIKEFRLPDVGEGLTEADIVRWHVAPGDPVTVNQIIVEIETAKAVVELPSPYAGTVTRLLVPEGETADVGTPIIAVDTGPGPAAAAALPERVSETEDLVPAPPVEGAVEPGIIGSPAPKAERQAVLVGYGVKLGRTTRRARKTPGAAAAAASATSAESAPAAATGPVVTESAVAA
ncbi:MAG: biotin/lipoyl-containing protein, partial [Streptosporangiaceae bacterium]